MAFSNPSTSGKPVSIKESGVTLTPDVASIDMHGSGVSPSVIGQNVDENIAGGGGGATTGSMIILEDDFDATTYYLGGAAPGTATSAASWSILKCVFTAGQWVVTHVASGAFTQIWDNRYSLTYT